MYLLPAKSILSLNSVFAHDRTEFRYELTLASYPHDAL